MEEEEGGVEVGGGESPRSANKLIKGGVVDVRGPRAEYRST